jgi:hypothetical protein
LMPLIADEFALKARHFRRACSHSYLRPLMQPW